jgi:microcystin-dependent protein
MGTPYLGEIKIIAWNYAPKGWAFCNGQIMSIQQNTALFSILGTTYGGNGVQTFALPNLQGRIPVHVGNTTTLGQQGGQSAHTLLISEMPAHIHSMSANTGAAVLNAPATDSVLGQSSGALHNGTVLEILMYAPSGPATTLNPGTIAGAGGSQPHDNMSPYLVLNYIIALQGIFPSRN